MRFFCVYIVCVWGASVSAQLCDGRYSGADDLLEKAYSRYGTLYSSGPNYESVGPTLEVYRLLSGLPDAGLASRRPWDQPFIDPGGDFTPQFIRETMARSLPRLHDPNFVRDTPAGSTDIEILLNVLTVIGPFAGWWLTPDAPHLTANEKVIAQYAVDDGLDWLLTVQSASARPYQIAWHLQRHTTRAEDVSLVNHAAERFGVTRSLPWFVATYLVQEGASSRMSPAAQTAFGELESYYHKLNDAVASCSASPAQYVAASIASFERLRVNYQSAAALQEETRMPPILRRMAAVQLGKSVVHQNPYRANQLNFDALITLSDSTAFARWLNVGRSYRAQSLEDLIAINDGVALDPKTYRLLNLLSANDLSAFAQSRPESGDEQRTLITAAFLRMFALGRDDEAAELVTRLQNLWPERAVIISEIWETNSLQGIRLARVALALPEPRTLIVPARDSWSDRRAFEENTQSDHQLEYWTHARRSRDLPISIRSGGFLLRDLTVWMQTIGSDPYAGWASARRTYQRGIIARDVMHNIRPPLPQSSGYYSGNGIADFAAWQELSLLGPETGLANRIGREIVVNARLETDTVLRRAFADRDVLAQELELVILQGRRMIHGDMEGQPLGKVAFELLHSRFRHTDAAARTPYWFTCQERCEP